MMYVKLPGNRMLEFAQYHKTKQFLVQPGVVHKLTNGLYVSGAALQSAFATATSHVSGVTGISFIGSAPGLLSAASFSVL